MGRSVTQPLFNIQGKPTLFQNLRAKLRAVFKNKKSANPCEFALLGTSVARCPRLCLFN